MMSVGGIVFVFRGVKTMVDEVVFLLDGLDSLFLRDKGDFVVGQFGRLGRFGRCPVRDRMLVEKGALTRCRCPVRDGMCVHKSTRRGVDGRYGLLCLLPRVILCYLYFISN
jgi:hypothetical protein